MDYYDLGMYSRAVTTSSPTAQLWFSRGLVWNYAYNHEEAIVSFEEALKADPDCAMAHWGIAYAIGPNYNKPWEAFEDDEKPDALARDFGRLGIDWWSDLAARDKRTGTRETSLLKLLEARNAIAHSNEAKLVALRAEGYPIDLSTIRRWRSSLAGLARTMDSVLSDHLSALLGKPAPW